MFQVVFTVFQGIEIILIFLLLSCQVKFNSLWPKGLQHARPHCPTLSPGVCPGSCPLNWWLHAAISSSADPFSSCPQYFPESESFPMSQLFVSGGQRIGTLASASVLLISIQSWFPLRSPCSPRDLHESSPAPQFKSIISSVLFILYGPAFISVDDYQEGQRLTDFCQENTQVIVNTPFHQHKRWLYTWTLPNGQYQSQIDYILCSQRWRSCTQSGEKKKTKKQKQNWRLNNHIN